MDNGCGAYFECRTNARFLLEIVSIFLFKKQHCFETIWDMEQDQTDRINEWTTLSDTLCLAESFTISGIFDIPQYRDCVNQIDTAFLIISYH